MVKLPFWRHTAMECGVSKKTPCTGPDWSITSNFDAQAVQFAVAAVGRACHQKLLPTEDQFSSPWSRYAARVSPVHCYASTIAMVHPPARPVTGLLHHSCC